MAISTQKYTSIDLFAGCGGLSTGLEEAGFTPILFSEIDKDARNTFLLNRHHRIGNIQFKELDELHVGDVMSLDEERLEKIFSTMKSHIPSIDFHHSSSNTPDLLCGGPPCQGYSGIGHRRTHKIEKKDLPSNTLFLEMVRQIRNFNPKIFLFENVKGILSARWTSKGIKGEIFSDVLREFRTLNNYEVKWSLIRSKDYGVPQNRPRVFVVGVRKDVCSQVALSSEQSLCEDAVSSGFFPEPSGITINPIDLLEDLIDPMVEDALLAGDFPSPFETKTYLSEPSNDIQLSLRTNSDGTLLKKGDRLLEQEYSRHKPHIVKKFLHMQQNDGQIPHELVTKKFAQRLLPRIWDNRGPFITTTSLPDDYVHFSQPRSLTVREWARLQTFPDWYKFSGNRTTGGARRAGNPSIGIFDREVPKYTQIGNAVPVRLARLIGLHLVDTFLSKVK